MTQNGDSFINQDTGEVDWDSIITMAREEKNTQIIYSDTDKKLACKKCGIEFFNKKYYGNFPLCDKHRNNTFKK